MKVVFVVGAPRSGTTLVQRMLAVHSEFFSIEGETALFTHQNVFDLERNHFHLPKKIVVELTEKSSNLVEFFEYGVSYLARDNENKCFIEKTPQHVFHLAFIFKHFPNCRIVNIVRDGRDCFCSARFNPFIPQGENVKVFANYWRKCIRSAMRNSHNSRLMTIKYEELVAKPEKTVEQLMSFLGHSFEHSQIEPAKLSRDARAELREFHALNNEVSIESIGRWKKELDKNELKGFTSRAGAELEYLGYAL